MTSYEKLQNINTDKEAMKAAFINIGLIPSNELAKYADYIEVLTREGTTILSSKEELDTYVGKDGEYVIILNGTNYGGIYQYTDTFNKWELIDTQLTAIDTDMLAVKYYGKNGVSVGTLNTPTTYTDESIKNFRVKLVHYYNIINSITNSDTTAITNLSGLYSDTNITTIPFINTVSVTNISGIVSGCNNLTYTSIINVIDMCLNSAITNTTMMNLSNLNEYSPFYNTVYDSTYYQEKLTDITNAGWSY